MSFHDNFHNNLLVVCQLLVKKLLQSGLVLHNVPCLIIGLSTQVCLPKNQNNMNKNIEDMTYMYRHVYRS